MSWGVVCVPLLPSNFSSRDTLTPFPKPFCLPYHARTRQVQAQARTAAGPVKTEAAEEELAPAGAPNENDDDGDEQGGGGGIASLPLGPAITGQLI